MTMTAMPALGTRPSFPPPPRPAPAANPEPRQSRDANRPAGIDDFVGQEDVVMRLELVMVGARRRGISPPHVLLSGPAGFGKTTLARVVADTLGVAMHEASGTSLRKVADLTGIFQQLGEGDVLFIDEIHRLPISVVEALYGPMEDGVTSITVGSKQQARTLMVRVPSFVLVAATTRPGAISEPMRTRFGFSATLAPYTDAELAEMIRRSWTRQGVTDAGAAAVVASRSKGVPRTALSLASRVLDVVSIEGGEPSEKAAHMTMRAFGIDDLGLDEMDRRILSALVNLFGGAPVGLDNLAQVFATDASVIEDREGNMIRRGLMTREAAGRCATVEGFQLVKSWGT